MIRITSAVCYWAAWVIIPLLMEVIPNMVYSAVLVWKRLFLRQEKESLKFWPEVTVIIPVYNSGKSLYSCIASVSGSSYPAERIEVLLVDNGSEDDSFQEFQRAQTAFPGLKMWWLSSRQGKSKALNKAIFNSTGKYVFNIDSDGILHRDALANMVRRFENHKGTDCMTGVILTNPADIERTEGFFLRQFQKLEFVEYAQAFLAGRNFESQFHSIFTLSGAFSAFRRSVLEKTYLYNTNTICEDAHLTFQVKDVLKKKAILCSDALFLVNPIESVNKFYTQRQRWQRGGLEVTNMFMKNKMKTPVLNYFKNSSMRVLIHDHTFAFPRFIWYFALTALGCMNYSFGNIAAAMLLIYLMYVFNAALYYCNVISFLTLFPEIRRYYAKKAGYVALLPVYSMFTFFVRFAGIINSLSRKSTWRTKTFTEEIREFAETAAGDFRILPALRKGLRQVLETGEESKCCTDSTNTSST